jgi:quinolinate synthase
MSIQERIRALKERANAVILAHNYQTEAVQDLADYVGDSLGLSRRAGETDAEVIVFCGVYFMAETAAILNPDRLVLIPDAEAGCPMARMLDADRLRELKAEYPGAAVVCYVNSTAEVKALSDVCCTSANAVEVVRSVEPGRPVIFVPDRHLGHYVVRRTGRRLILDRGYCPTHVRILPEHIEQLRAMYPDAEVMVHPECRWDVIELADVVSSTAGMLRHARVSQARAMIVGTEVGLLYRLRRENPDKEFIAVTPAAICPSMKRITPDRVLWSLQERRHEVRVPEEAAAGARAALDRMMELGRTAVGAGAAAS